MIKRFLAFVWVVLFPIVVWAAPQSNNLYPSIVYNLSYDDTAGALQGTIVGRGVTSPQANNYSIAQILNYVYDATAGALQVYLDADSIDELYESTSPELLLYNTTEEDTDGGRESVIRFKGEQSGGEVTSLATMTVSHEGTSDDEAGQVVLAINDGNDGDSPTDTILLTSDGQLSVVSNSLTDGASVSGKSGGGTLAINGASQRGYGVMGIVLGSSLTSSYGGNYNRTGGAFFASNTNSAAYTPVGVYAEVDGTGGSTTSFAFRGDASGATTDYGFYITSEDINYVSGSLGVGTTDPDTKLDVNGAMTGRELSVDPSNPDEGSFALWMSDGTGSGDDGDIMVKITAGGSTKTITLVDFSAF